MAECNLNDLPADYAKKVISEIIEEENYSIYHVVIKAGSGVGDNRLGDIIKIEINGTRKDGSPNSTHLILKLSPAGETLRQLAPVNGLYVKEVYAYSVLLPCFERMQESFKIPNEDRFKFVKCFKYSSEELKEYIVMEDLTTKGFETFDRLESFDSDHLELSIKNLASIHAFSFAIKASNPSQFEEMVSHASDCVDFGDHLQGVVERAFEQAILAIDDPVYEERLGKYSIGLYDKYCQYVDPKSAAPYNIICHGDSWSTNFLFRYEENRPVEIRTLDWQILRNASPVTDLAYMIFLSTDEQTRAKNFHQVLDLYYETLRIKLAAMDQDVEKCYPQAVFREHLKKFLPYGLLFSLFSLPIILSERDNAPDLVEMLKNRAAIKKESFSKSCIERLRGIVRDFVKYDLL